MKKFTILFLLLLLGSVSSVQGGFFADLFKKAEKGESAHTVPSKTLPSEAMERPENGTIFDSPDKDGFEEEPETEPVDSKSIFLSYPTPPSMLYVHAHQPIEVRALIADSGIRSISTHFVGGQEIKILNPNSPWKKIGEGEYRNRFIYKPLQKRAKLPSIEVEVVTSKGRRYTERIKPPKVEMIALPDSTHFSRIICHDFSLLSHNQKKYDEKNNIVVLEINATGGNLEDFHLPFAIREGIDQIKQDGQRQYIYYFAILPNTIKKIKFSYFKLPAKKYRNVSFDIILKDSKISTQTDLNPQKSRLQKYKQYAILGFATFLLILFLFYRKWYLLFFSLLAAIYLLYGEARIKKIVLPAGTKIKILPTENSTIFYTTPQTVQADLLLKKSGYIKVMLPNKKIGWIKAQ